MCVKQNVMWRSSGDSLLVRGRSADKELCQSLEPEGPGKKNNDLLERGGGRSATTHRFTHDISLLDGTHTESFEGSPRKKGCGGGQDSGTVGSARSTAMASQTTTTTTAAAGVGTNKIHVHVGGVNDDTLQMCYEALAMMDPSKKKGWEQATARCCPRVLEHECCPCYFLRVSQSNPWDAAQHLCRYWDERIRLFEDRAFEALTAGYGGNDPTGLSKTDVEILETGCLQLLPSDSQGRSVYFYNDTPLLSYMHRDLSGRLRVRWYIIHKAFTSGEPQAHRLVSIILLQPSNHPAADFAYASKCIKLPTVLPFQPDLIHLLALPSLAGTGRMAQAALSFAVNVIGSFFQHLVEVHNVDNAAPVADDSHQTAKAVDPRRRLLQKLRPYGLSKKGLPECAGGNFTSESFEAWLRRQRLHELHVFWSEEQHVQRRRDINRMHSRRKRVRRDEEFRDLRTVVQELKRANARAKDVHAELLCLLDNATALVTPLEQSKLLLPQSSVQPSPLLVQRQFESDNPLVVPACNFQSNFLETTQIIEQEIGCGRESNFLQGILGLDTIPVAMAPVLSQPEVALLMHPTLQSTLSGTVPVDCMSFASSPEPPLHVPANVSVRPSILPMENPAGTDQASGSTLSQLPQATECVPRGSNVLNSCQESSLGFAPYPIHSQDASTNPWSKERRLALSDSPSSKLFGSSTISAAPAAPPAPAPLIVLDLGLINDLPRCEKTDDDSGAETLFDGVMDSWGCLV